jgi:hypothetical protein
MGRCVFTDAFNATDPFVNLSNLVHGISFVHPLPFGDLLVTSGTACRLRPQLIVDLRVPEIQRSHRS